MAYRLLAALGAATSVLLAVAPAAPVPKGSPFPLRTDSPPEEDR